MLFSASSTHTEMILSASIIASRLKLSESKNHLVLSVYVFLFVY